MEQFEFNEKLDDVIFTLQGLYPNDWLWLNKLNFNHFFNFLQRENFDLNEFFENHKKSIKVFMYYQVYKNK